jgi:hypothetical protein
VDNLAVHGQTKKENKSPRFAFLKISCRHTFGTFAFARFLFLITEWAKAKEPNLPNAPTVEKFFTHFFFGIRL